MIDRHKETNTIQEAYLPHSRITPLNILQNLWFLKKQRADVYHITGDVHYAVLGLPKAKTVLTIHDCVFLEATTGLKRRILKFWFLDLPVQRAAVVTTISEKSKQDIIRYTNCAADKIEVIENPVSGKIYFSEKIFNKHKPVILFVGSKPNKNLERTLQALEGISCQLIVIGTLSGGLQTLADRLHIDVSAESNISEEALATRYAAADMVLFPSLYEGFGLPVVEGNRAGRIVVTSNISPMKEVAGDAAIFADPLKIQSIRQAVLTAINNDTLRNSIICRGVENVKRFDPIFIAAQYAKIYSIL